MWKKRQKNGRFSVIWVFKLRFYSDVEFRVILTGLQIVVRSRNRSLDLRITESRPRPLNHHPYTNYLHFSLNICEFARGVHVISPIVTSPC